MVPFFSRSLPPSICNNLLYPFPHYCHRTGLRLYLDSSIFYLSSFNWWVQGEAAVDVDATGGVEQSMAGQRRVEVFSTFHVETQKKKRSGPQADDANMLVDSVVRYIPARTLRCCLGDAVC
jgi:hypothetical protein